MTKDESIPNYNTHINLIPTSIQRQQDLRFHVQVGLLFLVSTISLGSHYVNHNLSSLGPHIMDELGIERTKFGLLFSSSEIPSIVIPIIGGVILSYLPYGPSAIFLSSSILFSASLCAIAVGNKSYVILLAGRFLFGVTNGALTTLEGSMIARWFPRKVGTGFGIMLLVSRLSSFCGLAFPAFLYDKVGLLAAMWFSAFVCIPSVISTVLYTIFDTRHKRRIAGEESSQQPLLPSNDERTQSVSVPSQRSFSLSRSSFLALIRSFKLPFWLICFLWVVLAGVVYSSIHFLPDALSHRFKLSTSYSGLLTGSLVFVAGVSSPIFGVMQDKTGRRAGILVICCGLLFVGTILCATGLASERGFLLIPSITLVYAGIGSLGAGFAAGPVTLMSSVALTAPGDVMPTALGLYKATENAGLAIIHLLIGAIRDVSGKYTGSFVLLASLALFGVFAALLLGYLQPDLAVPGSNRATTATDITSNRDEQA